MKSSIVIAVAAAVVGASSQSNSTSMTTDQSTSYVYSYYDDCSTVSSGPGTETNTVTSTYCSKCEMDASSSFVAAGGSFTTYTTVYQEFCPTGLQEKTYTVTESCSSPHPASTASREAGYMPQGFAVTTATCHVCGPMPVVATLTTPTPAASTANAGAGPAPAPAGQTGASSPPAGGSSPPNGGASSPAAGGSAGQAPSASTESSPQPAESSPSSGSAPAAAPAAGNAAPAPYAATARYASVPTGAPGSGSSGNSSAPIAPFTGAALRLSICTSFMIGVMGLIGVLAFAL